MQTTNPRIDLITTALQVLSPVQLTVHDDSAEHAGHSGAMSGGGHFSIHIVSDAFSGKTAVRRHQLIYEALGTLMQTDIHAIAIQAKAPAE